MKKMDSRLRTAIPVLLLWVAIPVNAQQVFVRDNRFETSATKMTCSDLNSSLEGFSFSVLCSDSDGKKLNGSLSAPQLSCLTSQAQALSATALAPETKRMVNGVHAARILIDFKDLSVGSKSIRRTGQKLPPGNGPSSIAMGEYGVFVGPAKVTEKTTDGGQTWTLASYEKLSLGQGAVASSPWQATYPAVSQSVRVLASKLASRAGAQCKYDGQVIPCRCGISIADGVEYCDLTSSRKGATGTRTRTETIVGVTLPLSEGVCGLVSREDLLDEIHTTLEAQSVTRGNEAESFERSIDLLLKQLNGGRKDPSCDKGARAPGADAHLGGGARQ